MACLVGLPPAVGDLAGVRSAAAEAGFYTRKRVNGRWVTGRFPKAETPGKVRRAKARPAVEDDDDDVADIPLPPVRVGDRPTVTAALSDQPEATPLSTPVPIAIQLPEVAAAPRIEETAEDRMLRLRRALLARADELASQPMRGSAAADAPAPGSSTVSDLAFASSSRKVDAALPPASGSATTPAVAAAPAQAASPITPAVAPAPGTAPKPVGLGPLEPRSVSFDFETGIKTTVFENSVVREPFDVAALRMTAGRLPQR